MAKPKKTQSRKKIQKLGKQFEDAYQEMQASGETVTEFAERKFGETKIFGWTFADLFQLFSYGRSLGVGPGLTSQLTGF